MKKSSILLSLSCASSLALYSFAPFLATDAYAENKTLYDVWHEYSTRKPYNASTNQAIPLDPALHPRIVPIIDDTTPNDRVNEEDDTQIIFVTNPDIVVEEPIIETLIEENSTIQGENTTQDSTSKTVENQNNMQEEETSVVKPNGIVIPLPTKEEMADHLEKVQQSVNNAGSYLYEEYIAEPEEYFDDELRILRTPENTPEAMQEILDAEREVSPLSSVPDAPLPAPGYIPIQNSQSN